MQAVAIKIGSVFQYKICYSKICENVTYIVRCLEFQYKICYSKMELKKAYDNGQVLFQYKICYSKIE